MRRFVVAAAFALAASLVAGAAPGQQPQLREVQLGEGAFSRGDALPQWVEPAPIPPGERGSAVLVRLADDQYFLGDTPVAFIERAVQVNHASALAETGQFQIDFVPQYNRVKLHALHVLRGEQTLDQTHSANLRFLQRETGLEQGVYSGVVSALLVVDDLRVGDTLHVRYSIEGDNPVFAGRFSSFASWDQFLPVKLRRVTLTHPKARPIRWQVLGERPGPGPEAEASESGGLRRLRFVGRDLPAVELEAQLPESYQALRILQFSEYASWNEVARWAAELFKVSTELSPEALALVERLRALPSREARISAALQWVQTEIRYFALSLGESSHRPHAPAVVLERRYGDCKDKSLLLISILRALGIEAKAVLVASGAKTSPESLLPTPMAFDHAIVEVVEGRPFYLDPTRLGHAGRLERMGQPLAGAQVLVIAPDSAALSRIETPNLAELVRTQIEERVTLAQLGGEGTVEIRKTWNGVQAEAVRVLLATVSPLQLRNFALRGFERRYADAVLAGEPEVHDDAERNSVVLITRLKAAKASIVAPQRWMVPITAANFNASFPMPDNLKRVHPLGIPTHPYEARYTLEVLWPENASAMHDPFTERVDNKHFSFIVSGSFRGNRARYEFTLRTRASSVEPGDLAQTLSDIRKVGSLLQGSVSLARAEVREVIRFGRPSLRDTIRAQLEDLLERTSKTIAGGRLSEADLAAALCARSEALAELSRTDAAINDGQEAVRLAPSDPNALACRANAFWNAGQFERAAADYSRALAVGYSEFRSFYRRGQARFYLGRLDEAASDFEKAAAAAEGDRHYAELWLAWTLKRLGRPLPPELAARARTEARGSWPRPALAMLAGALSGEEMLQEVERLKGDEREMTLAEAWFYLGQNHLAEKRSAAARDAFLKAREKGVVAYIEHTAAGFELTQLDHPSGFPGAVR